MKFSCSQSDFNIHLSFASRVVPTRPSHPVLANVLLVADEETQQIRLTGFDLSLGVQTSFTASIESGGTVTLPAKLLSEIVSRLPDGPVSLDNEEDEATVILQSLSGRYEMRGMGAEEFPELPAVESEVVSLPVESMIAGLRSSLFATSTDESKQVLTGVHVVSEIDGLEFAATDGHRLAVVKTSSQPSDESPSAPAADQSLDVTVPGKALRELERMLQSSQVKDSIAVQIDQGQMVVEWENQRLTSRLLEGQYPNYRQLVPKQFEVQMTVERRLLIGALERIAVLADQKNSIVKLSLLKEPQQVVISVDAQDVGSARETIAGQISGEDLDVAFNVKYLLEGLKAVTASEIQMQFNTPTSPAIMTPLSDIKMTYLIMPVQIRS